MNISIEQVLDAYDELVEAKNGTNAYGGNKASISVYKLKPYSAPKPTLSIERLLNPEKFKDKELDENQIKELNEEWRMMEKKCAEDFHTLCHLFSKKHKVDIKINNVDLQKWIEGIRAGEFRFWDKVTIEVNKK
jgi:hypothetical protein